MDLVTENVKKTLSGAITHGIGKRLADTHPVDAKAIQRLALRLGAQQQDVQWSMPRRLFATSGLRPTSPSGSTVPTVHARHKRPLQALLCRANRGCGKAETPHTA